MADDKTPIGEVTHYYTDLNVGIVKLSEDIHTGDTVQFYGATTDFEQVVDDMQYDHKFIDTGEAGQEVGIKVKKKVRDGDEVFLVKRSE